MYRSKNFNLDNQAGFTTSGLIAVLMTIGFISALGFAVWAFVGMQEYKTDVDEKISKATAVAVKEAEEEKEADFAERSKSPFKKYNGSSTYGSLSFSYPKTWSAFVEEKPTATVLDLYAHPNFIPGISQEQNYALRAQIVSNQYSKEVDQLDALVKAGKVKVSAYKLKDLPDVLGVRVVGELGGKKKVNMIVLPQRDKTIKIWTESDEFLKDFNRIIDTATFVP